MLIIPETYSYFKELFKKEQVNSVLLEYCNDARSYMARPVVVDARLISN